MIFRSILNRIQTAHQVAAPASTLLALTLALTFVARISFATPLAAPAEAEVVPLAQYKAWVTPRVTPGDDVEISVEADSSTQLEAYLPGLSFDRVPLVFDRDEQRFSARLMVPETAPVPGWFTLRVVDEGGEERDFRVHVDPVTGA